jgi:hypothetical protein
MQGLQQLGAGGREPVEKLKAGVFRRWIPSSGKPSRKSCSRWAAPNCNRTTAAPSDPGPPPEFTYFAFTVGIFGLLLLYYYWIMEAEQLVLQIDLISDAVEHLTVIVLAVILLQKLLRHGRLRGIAAGAFCWRFRLARLEARRKRCFSPPRPHRWCAGCSSFRHCSRRC